MLFPGRADYPLLDTSGLVLDPAFWPGYLFWAYDIGELMEMLDVDGADVDALSVKLTDPERWPHLRVPLREGGHLAVIYRNFPEDAGIDFERVGADGAPVTLASMEGDQPVGVLEWDELVGIATTAPRRSGVVLPMARFLLLLPLLAEAPEDAADQVRRSFRPRTGYGRQLVEVACALLEEHRLWPGGTYTRLWGEDRDGQPAQSTSDAT
ncbi:hypothetical protein [Catellatospora sp. NPDC049133]|uniref:hypothetical protein n=1 Tax=Catellatospora sp. NPDC049133 TaxID=3155499 RepID=UPI0033F7E068